MAAFNIVRFRVRPEFEQQFVEKHRTERPAFKGFLGGNLVRTGDRSYCFVGEWRNMNSVVAARPGMIEFLDAMRHMLEDLGGGLGVTDPVSGEVVSKLRGASAPKKRGARKAKKATKKVAKKKAAKKRRR
ncbi:MAG: antibiotic biosynthesis monooxygenase [Betaproteobacteria bacterium]|jgi:heme-degrading monooxygenase HmoA|nr:antibiotic biosynthesis monooxygenase [Betaproteobacteria bacterium]